MVKYRTTYTEAEVSAAVDRVRRKVMGVNEAARRFGVPRSTIRSRTKMNVQNVVRSGPQPILTPEEESEIEQWIFDMQRRGFPVTPYMLMTTVQEILIALPRDNPFKDNCPGKKWFKLFRQRHPQIALRTPEFISNASSKVSPEDVLKWFTTIETYLDVHDLMEILQDPERFINGDESNFLLNPKNKTVLALRGSRIVYDIERNNSKLAVTVMFSFTASGESVPPTIIYPYKSIPSAIAQSVPSSWGIAKSDKGWMTADVFRDYIRNVLNPYLEKRGVKKPVLYIVDGHASHINLQTSKMCRELGIILIALYPNVTHIMQPADVACFKPLKNGWPKAVAKLRRKDQNERVTLQNFAPVLQDCIRSSLTKQTIKKGFAASGLYPWNYHAIDMSKFLAKGKPKVNPEETEPEDDTDEIVSGSNIQRELVKAEQALQHCAEAIGPTRINKFRGEFVCLESEEEKALFDVFQILNDHSPDAVEAVRQQNNAAEVDAVDAPAEPDTAEEQEKTENNSMDNNDSGVSGLTLKDILTTPPTPKRKGTREYKSKKYHVLTSDEFIEEFSLKEQEKKRLEEEKENRKKAREQKKKENALKKQADAEKKANRIKRKALSIKN